MKKASLFIFFVVLVSIAIGALLFLSTGNFSFINNENSKKTTNAKTISLENINEISIKNSSVDIKVVSEDRTDAKINLINSKNSISTSTKDNKVYITVSHASNNNFFNFTPNAKLEITLPKSYSNKLSLESSSGNMSLNNVNLSDLTCALSSGNLSIKDLTITNLKCTSSSGTLNGTAINTVDSIFSSSSGNILLKKFTGNIETTTSSGDTKIGYEKFNNTLNAHSSSGNIRLTLPKNSEFNLDALSNSGNINCSFPLDIKNSYKKKTLQGTVKNDTNKIYLRTSSGNINITH